MAIRAREIGAEPAAAVGPGPALAIIRDRALGDAGPIRRAFLPEAALLIAEALDAFEPIELAEEPGRAIIIFKAGHA